MAGTSNTDLHTHLKASVETGISISRGAAEVEILRFLLEILLTVICLNLFFIPEEESSNLET